MIANTEVYPSKTLSKNVTFSHLFLGRVLTREDLCFGIVAHDNNFNSTETDHASTPLGIFASKSLAAWLPSRLAAKKSAFTLAEVLITLGIIGVVAALTLPSVFVSYQKKVIASQLKASFSLIDQAIVMTQAEIEDPNWVRIIDETQIQNASDFYRETAEKYIIPHLKIIKNYGVIVPSSYIYGFPKYKNFAGEQTAPTTTTGTIYYTFEMANGAYVFYKLGQNSDYSYSEPFFYIDVNGQKGPNILGKDVFVLRINYNGHLEMPGIRKTRAELLNICATDPSRATIWESCGALIQKDGWEITPDYPW